MKIKTATFTAAFILIALSSCVTKKEIRQYAATEIYPNDTVLQSIAIKKAMIVVAHDDDMCAMAGTISQLNKKGWQIAIISFPLTEERNLAQVKACKNILDTVMFFNLKPAQIRNDLSKPKTQYLAIPIEEFDKVFNKEIIKTELVRCINEFNPTVIFSLDNEMGGYGHAEHVLISQLIIDLTMEKRIVPSYIYQSVYTKHMESTIMKRHSERMKSWGFAGDEWEYAKRTYNTDGMPEPDVQIVITDEARLKMDYLMSYNERERKTIGFFVPEFFKFKAEEYFKIFDREFFRIIKI